MSWARPDAPQAVLANRRRVCGALEIPVEHLVQAGQIHGIGVRAVGARERGAGALDRPSVLAPSDALITNEPDVFLLGCFADCTPLLFFDPVQRAVGLAHAGWRGTVGGIAGATVRSMVEHYGSRPADLRVVIGPSAGPCCYVVGADVARAGEAAFPGAPVIVEQNGQTFFDLWEANRQSLLAHGVLDRNVVVSERCTIHEADHFFSHRATGGATGRFAAIIGVRG